MTDGKISILGVSDVSVGYGSPQLPALIESLVDHYQAGRGVLLEPDQSQRPARPGLFPDLDLHRLSTRTPHYSAAGMIEYNRQVAGLVEQMKPDVLVVASSLTLPALLKLSWRPKLTIYYMLESLSYFQQSGGMFGRLVLEMNRQAADRIDLAIFPEENRAAHDIELAGLHRVPMVVMYNSRNRLAQHTTQIDPRRTRKMLYSGTIHRELTLADYFVRPELRGSSIDLWGLIEGENKQQLESELAHSQAARYRGYLDAAELASIRPRYAYSIVMWAPVDAHTRFAAPNKFFEAVADGVPVIAAPHPQCQTFVERYNCGLLMEDWSFEAFRQTVHLADEMYGTTAYDDMVAGCRRAVTEELNWDAQFAKLAGHLPASL